MNKVQVQISKLMYCGESESRKLGESESRKSAVLMKDVKSV